MEHKLESDFGVESVLVPLIIQNHLNFVEHVLEKSTVYLEPLVRYLDRVAGLQYAEMVAEVE
ncbi:hypothetical protein EPO05_02020 [Patescibacteria group bacterium]|nr:MAG: hypothetical protein EPO05_02020 [Patescibacteria group bacterium]